MLCKQTATTILACLICHSIQAQCSWAEAEHFLALNMYHEARGEGVEGMMAVNEVVHNRLESPLYPDTPCAVVKQPSRNPQEPQRCSFSWWCDGKADTPVKDVTVPLRKLDTWKDAKRWEQAKSIARMSLLMGYGLAKFGKPATLFIQCKIKKKVKWDWKKVEFVGRVGNHCFYVERK